MIQNIILDLDDTLIHSVESKELAQVPQETLNKLKSHKFEKYTMFERPGLEEFIKTLARKYTIVVWTAAHGIYAEYVIDNIINPYASPNYVKYLLHADHCKFSMSEFKILKHLDYLYDFDRSFTRQNTLIIDDNDGIRAQNSTVITIKSFASLDPGDNELEKILQNIMKKSN